MLIPCNGRLIVRQHKKEAVTSLILAQDDQEAMRLPEGTVEATGDGSKFTKGDVVLFNDFAGDRIKHEEQEYLLVKETEILAKRVC